MIIRDIMDQKAITVEQTASLKDVIAIIRQEHMSDFAVVDSQGHFVGMVYERDLLRGIFADQEPPAGKEIWEIDDGGNLTHRAQEMHISDLMHTEVHAVHPDDSVSHIGARMLLEEVWKLPVVEYGRISGMISQTQIFEQVIQGMAEQEKSLRIAARSKPTVPSGAERRFFKRVDMVIPVAYKVKRIPGRKLENIQGKIAQTYNVSGGGLLMCASEALPEGSVLDVALDLFKNMNPVKCPSRVVRCVPSRGKEGSFDIGLMFLVLTIEERKKIIAYLDQYDEGT